MAETLESILPLGGGYGVQQTIGHSENIWYISNVRLGTTEANDRIGWVAEWSNAAVLKTAVG